MSSDWTSTEAAGGRLFLLLGPITAARAGYDPECSRWGAMEEGGGEGEFQLGPVD